MLTIFEPLFPVLVFALGAVLASFAGVISERIATGESWARGRSRCNSCTRTLSGLDLIPIFSWVFTGGKCRTCRAGLPYLYPLTETTLAGLCLATYFEFGFSLLTLLLIAFLFFLTILVLYDLRHTIVPFRLSLLLILLAGVISAVASTSAHQLGVVFITAGAIALGFFLMHVLSLGRWMGLGDAPIALALALIAGRYALTGLLFSFWIGAAIGIGILVLAPRGHKMGIEVPFVPFLAAGFLLALFTQWNLFAFM